MIIISPFFAFLNFSEIDFSEAKNWVSISWFSAELKLPFSELLGLYFGFSFALFLKKIKPFLSLLSFFDLL